MNLKIDTSENGNEMHMGPLFAKAEERQFGYQNEAIAIRCHITAHPPGRGDGSLNHDLPEDAHSEYILEIGRFTGKSLEFKLRAKRRDIVDQRKREGAAVTEDVLIKSLSFAEFCNLIFGSGAMVFHEKEAMPDRVKQVMRGAYDETGPNARMIQLAKLRLRAAVANRSGRCNCGRETVCPLGRTKEVERCTAQELLAWLESCGGL